MFNAFACLELPPRPWLDETVVRDAFHRLAAERHPDRAAGDQERFSELTSAYATLREPQLRLRHLLELEKLDVGPSAGIPSDLTELFPLIAHARQHLSAAVSGRNKANNHLARSIAAAEIEKAKREMETVATRVDDVYQASLGELKRVDSAWPSASAKASLLALHGRFAFLTKWRDQLRESLLQLQLT